MMIRLVTFIYLLLVGHSASCQKERVIELNFYSDSNRITHFDNVDYSLFLIMEDSTTILFTNSVHNNSLDDSFYDSIDAISLRIKELEFYFDLDRELEPIKHLIEYNPYFDVLLKENSVQWILNIYSYPFKGGTEEAIYNQILSNYRLVSESERLGVSMQELWVVELKISNSLQKYIFCKRQKFMN